MVGAVPYFRAAGPEPDIDRTNDNRPRRSEPFANTPRISVSRCAAAGCCGTASGLSSNSANRTATAAKPGRSATHPLPASWAATAAATRPSPTGAAAPSPATTTVGRPARRRRE